MGVTEGVTVGKYVGRYVGVVVGLLVGVYEGAALFIINDTSSNLVEPVEVKVNVILAAFAVKVVA